MDSGSSVHDVQRGDAAAAAEAAKRAEVERLTDRLAQRFADVPQMSVQQLKAAMESPSDAVVLVDARLQEERAVSMLPGAISEAEWEARKAQYSKNKTLLVSYCTIGFRSCQLVKREADDGWRGRNLAGSALAWAHAGYPLVDPASGREVKRLHTFSREWALQPDGVEPVYFQRPYLSFAAGWLRGKLPPWLGGDASK